MAILANTHLRHKINLILGILTSDKLVKTILILFQCVQYQIIDFSSKRISNYQYTGIAKKMLTKKKK